MVKKRTGEPWMTAIDYGRTLTGLSLNFIVRDVAKSLPFYTDVLGMTAFYGDVDFAALKHLVLGFQVQLHADHTYESMPWATRLEADGDRGLGAEVRVMGVDPDIAEKAARTAGFRVLLPAADTKHGWREVHLADQDGYTFAVGKSLG